MSGASRKNEPQMNADERRFVVPGMCLNERGAGSMRLAAQEVGMRQWRLAERSGLEIGKRGAQSSKFISKYHQILSVYLFFEHLESKNICLYCKHLI
jgi:hypothetical protein